MTIILFCKISQHYIQSNFISITKIRTKKIVKHENQRKNRNSKVNTSKKGGVTRSACGALRHRTAYAHTCPASVLTTCSARCN